jgi:hypothetical protein
MARASAIACGHEDANDLDRLRHDPLMKIAVGRCPIHRRTVGVAIDHQPSGECAEQDGGGAAHRSSRRSGWHDSEAGQAGYPRHRRHVLCGTWRSAACVLERASRRARLRVHAYLSRGKWYADHDDPAPGAHPEVHGGEDCHQACNKAHEATLAEHPRGLARRQPLRPGRGHGMGGRQRCGLHLRPRRQCRARCPRGRGRRQSALPSCQRRSLPRAGR